MGVPRAPLRWLYRIYLHRIVPRLAGLLTGEKCAYEYLGASIEEFPQGDAMNRLIAVADAHGRLPCVHRPLEAHRIADSGVNRAVL